MATIFIRRRPDSVMEWEIQDVLDWLKELKLERFCKRFQSHLITGPIILQMDDSLLNDLQIYSIAQREVLLTESRRLCLQELELVDKALEYKQKLDELPKSDSDVNKRSPIKSSGDKLDKLPHKLSTKRTIDKNIKCNHTEVRQACSDKADEVATRATRMVTILSQENSSLRAQIQKSSSCKDQCIKMLQQEIFQLNSENQHLRKEVNALEMENKRVLDKLQESCDKYHEKIKYYEGVIHTLKQEKMLLQDKFQAFKDKTIEREVMRSCSPGFDNYENPCNLQNSHAYDCHSDHKEKENDLQLINKVYNANKRCAELEDTIRWLYAELLLVENSKKSLEYPNACKAEEKAPSEPEWPSLIGKTSTKEGIEEKSDENEGIVNRFITQGLPTDTDEDIWKLKGLGNSSELLSFHKWKV